MCVCVSVPHKWYGYIKDQVKHKQLSVSVCQRSGRYFTSQRATCGRKLGLLSCSILRIFTEDIIFFESLTVVQSDLQAVDIK